MSTKVVAATERATLLMVETLPEKAFPLAAVVGRLRLITGTSWIRIHL
ncbi:hypothetical protein MMEU_1605 [Mycobacterium marinum str. Europe]|nr:hypothetical protein MMEU_1605 [Mycobacterium marinum str. Europe]